MIRLTDEQWKRIRDHFPEEQIPDGRPGRKPIATRRVLEAVLWVLNTGAQWHVLPQGYQPLGDIEAAICFASTVATAAVDRPHKRQGIEL